MKLDELKNRKTTRLKGADYNRNQAVFLTICTKERRCVLSRIVGTGVLDGPQIELTKYGQIADKYIRQLNDFYDDLSVESYVIMPNHIHIMLWVKGAGNGPSRTPVPTGMVVWYRFACHFKTRKKCIQSSCTTKTRLSNDLNLTIRQPKKIKTFFFKKVF